MRQGMDAGQHSLTVKNGKRRIGFPEMLNISNLRWRKTFKNEFMTAMYLPHMTDEFKHLKGIVPDEILHQK